MVRLPLKHAKDSRTFKNYVFTLRDAMLLCKNIFSLSYVSAVVRFQPFIMVSFNFHWATKIGIWRTETKVVNWCLELLCPGKFQFYNTEASRKFPYGKLLKLLLTNVRGGPFFSLSAGKFDNYSDPQVVEQLLSTTFNSWNNFFYFFTN
jgi:hypothetical protein